MLCIVIAWLALLLFLVYQSHVLKSRKATLFLWPFRNHYETRKLNTHMATVQILAFITLDGYLAHRTTFPDLWGHPENTASPVSGRMPCPVLILKFPSYPLRNGNADTPAYILRRPPRKRFPLRTACSVFAWLTSWCCISCPVSRGKVPACLREVPTLPHGNWSGHGVSEGMSAVCITGGFRADDYPSAGLSLNVISIL